MPLPYSTLNRGSLAFAIALIASQSAFANDYSALFKAKKYDEVEHLASTRLHAEPNNADALIAKIDLILMEGKENRLDDASKLAEQCISANPGNSECQTSLGNVLGTKAMMGGIMSAIGYASKIRDAFKKAVELDPKNFAARDGLLQYYLQAPSIAGGGKGKAQNLIDDTAKINAAASTLMQAKLDLSEEKFSRAESSALSVNVAGSEVLGDMQRGVLQNIGGLYVQQKKYADASRIFQEIQQRFPDKDTGTYGMARTLQEQGLYKDALSYFEKALAVETHAHTYYRIAQCWQAVSDKVKAITTFEKALNFKPQLPKRMKEDAEAQLKTLRS
ncbi:tetratricopeptide repeat protein [Undibacterium sp. Jales W-56]|uniref:tetratricopeptide repeat protein n=1 Tax=Undibacterium sp. Jales W-56 TaxID=2897325 RepID=UPI0021D32270|nr:tetratricopeptide repeat protein [Undibacterium sp. Jales W-56]MCU6435683.1 tetratricopeptide repeat protein [Undibacterium sp. Jales W-56]